jgi:hypothetical protein
MSERPGFRQIWISEAAYRRLGLHDAAQVPAGGLAERQIGSGCGLVIVYNPSDGSIIDAHCGTGGCGFIDRLLGRSCGAIDSGSSISCGCFGGWFDRIFRP